jgi:hypothetical protein
MAQAQTPEGVDWARLNAFIASVDAHVGEDPLATLSVTQWNEFTQQMRTMNAATRSLAAEHLGLFAPAQMSE